MSLLITFARTYRVETIVTLFSLLLAGVMEGLSFSTLLPLLSTAIGDQADAKLQSAQIGSTDDIGPGELVLDGLSAMGVPPTIGVLLVIIVLGISLKSGLLLLAKKRVGYIVANIATELRLTLIRALLFTRWEYYISQPVGKFANSMASESRRASKAYMHGANTAVQLIQVFVYSIVAFLVSWKATLICLGASVTLLIPVSYFVRAARKAGKRQTRYMRSLLTHLTDSLQSVKPLKTMARENLIGPILETENRRLNRALRKEVLSTEALRAAQELLLTTLIAGGIYVVLTWWNLPLASLMVLVLLLAQMVSRLGKAQREYQKMMLAESAFWALQTAIKNAERERESLPGSLPPCLNRDIQLDKVQFAYKDTSVLQEGSLTIPVGVMTVIVGPSGAGKTTIADLTTGLLRPQQGEVRIDGLPLDKIALREWRGMIGYVPQETLLLNDTVFKNVALGEAEIKTSDVESALRAAGAWDFVASMPQGMDSIVGERGASLSGGQRQRVAIARALVHNPKLLILDEATSALDPDSEAAICQTLQALRGQVTILAISHQPALTKAADRVYRLRDGIITLIADRLVGNVSPEESKRDSNPNSQE
jgi:ATP-binding cassette subfamily C protein